MRPIRKTSKVTNVHPPFHSRYYADDGDLADAGNGTRSLVAAFDTASVFTRRSVKLANRG